ncbi:MAG: choline dehydrogenase [Burkholderiaceae bacterium]
MSDGSMEFDFIVVGAGSSGCALAGRLSEDPGSSVLLLEAGPPDDSFWIHLPIGYGKTMWSDRVNWRFETEPEPAMGDRKLYWPRGKTLGGSSSINGLIYIRGQREDYDHWAALGNPGWGFDDVLPYFRRAEDNARGASEFHGAGGPLKVSNIDRRNELIDAFIAGAEQIGVPPSDDFNGATQEGVGYYQLNTHRGWRYSAAKAYLKPARKRANLRVETEAQAAGLVFADGEKRVIGVRYRQGGQLKTATCRAEVLLAAGAVQSPQLLELSGIGSAAALAGHGVALRHELAGVGENLQDHLQVRLTFECAKPITTNDDLNSLFGRARIGLQWLLRREGPLAVGINQGGCFMRALKDGDGRPVAATPDIQFHVATLSADMAGGKVHAHSGFTFSVCQLRPESRGSIHLKSADPFQAPAIRANYLATDLDRRTMLAGVQAARDIAAAPAMRPLIKREYAPGDGIRGEAALLEFCRGKAQTIFHPVGTAKMGPASDPGAVVDARLRVHGVAGLRVVDCSVMPTLVSGNTHAPAVMIAEKAVDMIHEDRRRDRGRATEAAATTAAEARAATV